MTETTNTLTLLIFVFPWGLWLGWEIYLLVRRGNGHKVKTLSMQARDYGHKLTSVVWIWGAMSGHWWWPAPALAPVALGVFFWLIALGLVGWDAILWRREVWAYGKWLKRARWPILWLVLGLLAGRFLFPQMAS